MVKFLGFYMHESKEDGVDIFVAWQDNQCRVTNYEYTCYAYVGGHSGLSKEYLKESKKIKPAEVRKLDSCLIPALLGVGYTEEDLELWRQQSLKF